MWVADFLIFTLCYLSGITTLGLVTDSLLDHAAVTSSPKSQWPVVTKDYFSPI